MPPLPTMLQYIANTPAEALAAVEAGCRWIHYCDPSTLDDIIPACRDAEVIVTIPGRHAPDKDTRVHGVILAPGDMAAAPARELLGPNAIIGVEVSTLFEILGNATLDVDFFVLRAPADQFGQIIGMARSKGVEQRICALSDDPACLSAGADALMSADLTLLNPGGQ